MEQTKQPLSNLTLHSGTPELDIFIPNTLAKMDGQFDGVIPRLNLLLGKRFYCKWFGKLNSYTQVHNNSRSIEQLFGHKLIAWNELRAPYVSFCAGLYRIVEMICHMGGSLV
ncbi:hypothetical protein ACJX0J_023178 [Zea mays]